MFLSDAGEKLCFGVMLIKNISLLVETAHIFAFGAELTMSTVNSQGSFCK